MARQKRTRAEWADAVRAWEGSGESQALFCAARGLEVSTFRWWRWRLKQERQASDPSGGWVELAPFRVAEETSSSGWVERDLEVVLGDGVGIRVPVGFDEPTLVRLIRALGVIAC